MDRTRCADCGQPSPVMVAMEPGRGNAWSLCARCWSETAGSAGAKPAADGQRKKAA